MISPIHILKGNLENYKTESDFTGWYGIKRLMAEGPYELVNFSKNTQKIYPESGPLAKTGIDFPAIWCAVSEGKLVVAPKTSDTPPSIFGKDMRVRGYYELDAISKKIVWYFIEKPWAEEEISEFRLLSNPSYTLYKKVRADPEHLFLFGAGASYGSDGKHLYNKGLLPPLGKNLYELLRNDSNLKHWKNIPSELEEIFYEDFEKGMEELDKRESNVNAAFFRDIELSLFFSRYSPDKSNIYWKLGKIIGQNQKKNKWVGAAITLNYERLLEESFMRNSVFTVVKGVTFYDDNIPTILDEQLFEVCYPHGGCQFFMGQSWIGPNLNVVFGDKSRLEGNTGANHLLKNTNISIACRRNQIPLICRYHPSKRASVNNYFIDTQKNRAKELIESSKTITIVGVKCHFVADEHIWEPLSNTKAFIVYVEPSPDGQNTFRIWANDRGKKEGDDYMIIPKSFKDSFVNILDINRLQH